ncbi:hypothetical protein BJY04DRAFT_216418 [Aspergillus karnatakaensis]|uniref:uncharacterized protein n=1 Tax=Aspergillus karnatakaensis TaxID=1810916 RepID=UPI003CCD4944
MDSTLLGLQPAWTALAGLLTLAVVYNLSQLLSKPPPPSGIPIALKDEVPDEKERIERYMSDTRELLIHGYTKFKNQVFGISTTEGTSVVLPLQLLDDLRGQRSLTFASFLEKQFTLKKYTKLGNLTEQQIQVLNKEFNPSLPAYIPVIHRLICDFFPFGACEG